MVSFDLLARFADLLCDDEPFVTFHDMLDRCVLVSRDEQESVSLPRDSLVVRRGYVDRAYAGSATDSQ